MQIAGHKLVGVPFKAAHSSGGAMTPTLIVLHDTAGRLDKGSSVDWFCSKECPTSAHILVERDGSITQMVPFNKKAFHAGRSSWKGREFCNGFSIGIEIVNPGELDASGKAWFSQTFDGSVHKATEEHGSHNWLPYTTEQIEAVKAICKALADKYEIEDITTHWFISPKRKIDPNPLFPLEEVKAAALGRVEMKPIALAEPAAMPAPIAAPVAEEGSDITFDWLVEQGCRAAQLYKTARAWFWKLLGFGGATTGISLMGQATGTDNGTITAAGSLASDHAVLILGILVVVLMCALAAVICLGRRYLVTALQRSGYVPKAAA